MSDYEEWLDRTKVGVSLDISRWQDDGKSPKEITDLLFEHVTIARAMRLAYNDVPRWLGGDRNVVEHIAREIAMGRSANRPDKVTADIIYAILKDVKTEIDQG